MSLLNPNSQKHYFSTKHSKKRLTQDQVRLLEASFSSSKKLDPERKLQLARELGIPPRQIAIWYQNKRARWKTQSLELDCNSLQLNLEAAISEKRRLEREVQRLGAELEKAQMLLLAFNQLTAVPAPPAPPPGSSLSSCCDDQGLSCSLHDDVMSSSWVNNDVEALRLQELYASLMNTNGTSQNGP